jgi:hypothetical protein
MKLISVSCIIAKRLNSDVQEELIEDTKGVIRIRKSKNK